MSHIFASPNDNHFKVDFNLKKKKVYMYIKELFKMGLMSFGK
jgi:hypothetical protein